MTKMIAVLFAMLLATTNAMASAKLCIGGAKNQYTKGFVIRFELDAKQIVWKTLKPTDSEFSFNTTYPAYEKPVHGHDGKIYLTYKGESNDYQEIILVDQDLLRGSTSGVIKVRGRGEGFFEDLYFCKDAL